jgi:DNA ligase-1
VTKIKPMLAATIKDLTQIQYPCWCTSKIDGIRCLIVDGEAKSRTLKPIPNKYIRQTLSRLLLDGVDGELVLKQQSNFSSVSSAIMSEEGEPDFLYLVFDIFNSTASYLDRVNNLKIVHNNIKVLKPTQINNSEELISFEHKCLSEGHEGVMIRNNGPYKYGRSTVNEGYLMKLKKFMDSEATIIGVYEKLKNNNEPTKDNLGHTQRSSHKSNLQPMNTLGGFVVRDCKSGVEFKVGSGFTDAQRNNIWNTKHSSLVGSVIKYKTQSYGAKDKPRFPIFLGFRHSYDVVEE